MKSTQKTICIFLIGIMLSSGFPLYNTEDASRDNQVDLKDLILVVKKVAKTADNTAGFKSKVRNAVSTFNTAAGLKTIIKPAREKGYNNNFHIDFPFLISSNSTHISECKTVKLEEKANIIISITFSPEPPPPKFLYLS